MSPARASAKAARVLTMGATRRWLYSRRLFPEPQALVDRVTHLLDAAEASGNRDAHAAQAGTAGGAKGAARYLANVRKQTGYFAAWLPSESLSLGDVGVVRDGRFVRLTSLTAEGIAFESSAETRPRDLDVSHAVTLGPLVTAMESLLRVSLEEPGAFLLHARDCRSVVIADRSRLGHDLLEARRRGTWKSEWCVIDELVEAGVATILVGISRAHIELRVDPELQLGSSSLAIETGSSVARSEGSVLMVIGARGCTPLYRMSRIKRSFPLGALALLPET
jgi:hypothetical protein